MRKLLLSAVFLAGSMIAAQAGTVVGGFVAGGASGNQGSAFSNTNTTNGSGYGSGQSASGTNFSIGANGNDSTAHFVSKGSAYSAVTMTPMTVTTESNHTAFSAGRTDGNAAFSATNQTFGQSSGNVAFTNTDTSTNSNYQNSKFHIVGALGFVSFENGFTQQ